MDVSLPELQNYRDVLANAIVTNEGLRGKPGIQLPKQQLTRKTERPVATYTLMHTNDIVCNVYPAEDRIELIAVDKLPFALTGSNLSVSSFEQWLTYRIDNLSRTYMNKVYILRKVGRDRDKILRDSCAISITDNFWILRSDISTSWGELKSKRDQSIELANTALTGQISQDAYAAAVEDTTSLYTIKGAFPKAVLRGFILKKDNNAEYEAYAYQLGAVLGISAAEAAIQPNDIVSCRIFTTDTISMVHARDLLHLTDYDKDTDEHRALYEYFIAHNRLDIARELERLYIFMYLTINTDFHYENFGFLYDTQTFRIISTAPAYDFNSAFNALDDPAIFYSWIVKQLPIFLRNHKDMIEKLRAASFAATLASLTTLTQEQKDCIQVRAEYLSTLLPT